MLFLQAFWRNSVREMSSSRPQQSVSQLLLIWKITWFATSACFNDLIYECTHTKCNIIESDIIRFKIRILTTPPMSKHSRIFTQPPPCSPLTPSTSPSVLVLDPFNNNYTLTGLVTHIDSSLGELIASKKASEEVLKDNRAS
jgi:hypothetical protein